MTERMSKQPVIIGENGVQKLKRISLTGGTFKEEWLQKVLEDTPSILPTAEIAPIFSPLICVAREVHVKTDDNNSGRIDNLYISKHGHLVIVETKLWNNPESRRMVVAQILDYAKEVREWDYEKLNNIYQSYHKTKKSVFDAIVAEEFRTTDEEADFIDTVNHNISSAQFLLMIVGDGIRSGVEKMVEYMNAFSPDMQHRLALCELEVYDFGDNRRLIVPQLTTKTTIIERGIIRIEKGNIKVNFDDANESDETSESNARKDAITREELISGFVARNKNKISQTQIDDFMEDLTDLGLIIKYTPLNASVYCHVKSLNKDIQLFFIPGKTNLKKAKDKNKAVPCFVPVRLLRRMETLGLPTDSAKQMFEAWRPMLSKNQRTPPYEDYAKFYFLDNSIITDPNKRNEFLGTLEEFQNNL